MERETGLKSEILSSEASVRHVKHSATVVQPLCDMRSFTRRAAPELIQIAGYRRLACITQTQALRRKPVTKPPGSIQLAANGIGRELLLGEVALQVHPSTAQRALAASCRPQPFVEIAFQS